MPLNKETNQTNNIPEISNTLKKKPQKTPSQQK